MKFFSNLFKRKKKRKKGEKGEKEQGLSEEDERAVLETLRELQYVD